MIIKENVGDIRLLILNHENKHNPFSENLENAIKAALQEADSDPNIKAIVVYGGKGRSFSSGGDFNEVKNLSGSVEVERWIDRVIDLYTNVLKVSKPTVAAIEGYAIGMGFQFAMMFDYKVMSNDAKFIMPELKHGIGCSVGAAILEFTHSHNLMKKIVYECKELDADECERYHIVNEISDNENILEQALVMAQQLAGYPFAAYKNTKNSLNSGFIEKLEKARESSKLVHKQAFSARDAQKHFEKVLGTKY
ncbi:enoyl-CoA hydratase/isomerase family protein [Enterobacter mori]|uniref:enoyl-CoA hydratase/isomerase family protein n=1 Tax=Enterobacter mori TaxID=539813 RepID=UPI002ED2F826|nr:enoyl-CoA hydratase/isomerase family protein [Enterobacter mori]